jgi:hypothetical protein
LGNEAPNITAGEIGARLDWWGSSKTAWRLVVLIACGSFSRATRRTWDANQALTAQSVLPPSATNFQMDSSVCSMMTKRLSKNNSYNLSLARILPWADRVVPVTME